jgi:hypothetical protein
MMIAVLNGNDDGHLLVIGLSRKNIERLMAGQPLKPVSVIDGKRKVSVSIMFGETEEAVRDQLADAIRFISKKAGPPTDVSIKPL